MAFPLIFFSSFSYLSCFSLGVTGREVAESCGGEGERMRVLESVGSAYVKHDKKRKAFLRESKTKLTPDHALGNPDWQQPWTHAEEEPLGFYRAPGGNEHIWEKKNKNTLVAAREIAIVDAIWLASSSHL